eukprot:CAMPEP_0117433220 /NCGR_PEP_ID=MMETSP0758-20121206/12605_1 /TAXON_ID=63605 /ORGANISM="Percolomonas cosmopolitus, Strain AE-1 (ATCC 50343)" /LENGTH=591 /DNA_ID=CAMNT_0005223713 /DNA_START=94 /DNA_END=1869 /DNA_ORIENTATION=-
MNDSDDEGHTQKRNNKQGYERVDSIRSRLQNLFVKTNNEQHIPTAHRISPDTPPPPIEEKKTKVKDNKKDEDIVIIEQEDIEENSDICIICQEKLEYVGMHRASALLCGHVFGNSCIHKWFESQSSCPICKKAMPQKRIIPLYLQENVTNVYKNHMEKRLEERSARERSRVRAVKRDLREIQKTLNTIKEWVKPFGNNGSGEPTMAPEMLMKSIFEELKALPTHRFLPTKETELKNPLSNSAIKLKRLYRYATSYPPSSFDFVESFYRIVFCQVQFGNITLFDLREGQTLFSMAIGPRNSFKVRHLMYYRPYSMVLVMTNTGLIHGLTYCANKLTLTGSIALPPTSNMNTFALNRHYLIVGGMGELIVYDLCQLEQSPLPIARVKFSDEAVCLSMAFDKQHHGVMIASNNAVYMFTVEQLLDNNVDLKPCTPTNLYHRSLSPMLQYNGHTNQFCFHSYTKNRKQSYHLYTTAQLTQDQQGKFISLPSIPSYLSLSSHVANMVHSQYVSINRMHIADQDVVSLDDVNEELCSYIIYPFKDNLFIYDCTASSWITKYALKSPLTSLKVYSPNLSEIYIGHLHPNAYELNLYSN